MSANEQKIRRVIEDELGVREYDLVWFTTSKGKPYDYRLTVDGKLFRANTTRAIIRALRRNLAKKTAAHALA